MQLTSHALIALVFDKCQLGAAAESEQRRRKIRLPQVVTIALTSRGILQRKEWLAAGGAWTDSGLVFTNAEGTTPRPESADGIFG